MIKKFFSIVILFCATLFWPLIAMEMQSNYEIREVQEEQNPIVRFQETEVIIPSNGKIVRVYGFYENGEKTIFFLRLRTGETEPSIGIFKNPDNTCDFFCNRKFPCDISTALEKYEKYERMFNNPHDIAWRKLKPKTKIIIPAWLVNVYEKSGDMKKNSDGTYSKIKKHDSN